MMKQVLRAFLCIIALLPLLPANGTCARAGGAPPAASSRQEPANPSLTADVAAVLHRPTEISLSDLTPATRTIRVLVHYGRTEFFVANGRPFGVEYEAFSEYEKYLNRNRPRHSQKISVVFIPVRFEELLPLLQQGKGDIAAGLLTVTDERKKEAAFTTPYVTEVEEVLVAYKGARQPAGLEELSGKSVHVLRGSSFTDHLLALNHRLREAGRPPVNMVEMPVSANADDILEMVNAGIFEYTVTDDFTAELWARVLPDIRIVEGVTLHPGGTIAWAVRPGNPALLASMNGFVDYIHQHLKSKAHAVWNEYFRDTTLIRNPLDLESSARFRELSPHFKEAGGRNKLDWLLMMAQGYQESQLDQRKRSPRGAIGIMQLLPGTARDIGYRNITNTRNNIAAGVAYLDFLRRQYFDDPAIPPDARVDFALAAYNAGPGRIQALRKEAEQRGLDPNLWFRNVERVALDRIGEETVRYVSNINKYYIAYRMSHHLDEDKSKPPAAPTDFLPPLKARETP